MSASMSPAISYCRRILSTAAPIHRRIHVHKVQSIAFHTSINLYKGKSSNPSNGRSIFSGIQPTGIPHLGNYFGAIKQWVELQDQFPSVIYSVVDMHSITVPQVPTTLRKNIYDMVACLLACGIDPKKCILFQQSSVGEHAELSWILGCHITMAKLQHLPQWKEKSQLMKEVPLGIITYPVLQSADILLYKTTDVPVGDDQVKHIEFTRHLAKLFNNKYGFMFPMPKPMVGDYTRIKSLREPSKKMSKSEPDVKSRIELTDSPDDIFMKIKKAVTDCESQLTYDPDNRPGISNLIDIHAATTGLSPQHIVEHLTATDKVSYKKTLAEIVIEHLTPIRTEAERLRNDHVYLDSVLEEGAEKARSIACSTMKEVKQLIGLNNYS